jgi:surface polysaccharide O-acyltransferase-like enzyme
VALQYEISFISPITPKISQWLLDLLKICVPLIIMIDIFESQGLA